MTKKVPSWEEKYWQQRQQGTNVPKPGAPNFARKPNGPLPEQGDWDITDRLKAKIQQQAALTSMGQGESQGTANLVEGLPYYTRLQSENFGHTASLFKTAGIIQGPTARNVTVKKEVTGYVIDNMQTVDMSRIGEGMKVSLVEVSVPFLGNFLVPKEAIVKINQANLTGNNKIILKG